MELSTSLLSLERLEQFRLSLLSTRTMLLQLRNRNNEPVCRGKRFLSVIGFASNITRLIKLSENLLCRVLNDKPVTYLLTYKFSQDHLEMLFAFIRKCLGSNNNPKCCRV